MCADPIRDADGRLIREGARVVVLGLAAGLLTGLPPEDVAFLERAVGTIGAADEIVDGEVSVMLVESASHFHFIRSPGNILRVTDGTNIPATPS